MNEWTNQVCSHFLSIWNNEITLCIFGLKGTVSNFDKKEGDAQTTKVYFFKSKIDLHLKKTNFWNQQ